MMLKKSISGKKGNEIIQTLVIVAVLSALAITICVAISTKVKSTSSSQLNTMGNGLDGAVTNASSQ